MMHFKTLNGGNAEIRMFLDDDLLATVESGVFDQARDTANTPGVDHVCVLPDCHTGYGAPIGSVVVSTDRVIPGPVGYDIGCGMAVYTTRVPASVLKDRPARRRVIDAIDRGIAMGEGRSAAHGIDIHTSLVLDVVNHGAQALAGRGLIPHTWVKRCENPQHQVGEWMNLHDVPEKARRGFSQLGTLGGGNHFLELQELKVEETMRHIADTWGLFDGQLVVMVHSGSRGFGHGLGSWAFDEFKKRNLELGETFTHHELVHAPVDSDLGRQYLRFVAAGANFALCNRLLMAQVIKRAIEDELGEAAEVDLLYEISHNLAQHEGNHLVHRKGTTRAFPAGHPALVASPWETTGHPVITPGSMGSFSAIQVGLQGAAASFYSINHGAGRRMSRSAARKVIDQAALNAEMDAADILTNQRNAPIDEAPAAYKDLGEVLRSVESFNLAAVVARCYPIASMKGADEPRGSHRKPAPGGQ